MEGNTVSNITLPFKTGDKIAIGLKSYHMDLDFSARSL
jgi:hypothetical protein